MRGIQCAAVLAMICALPIGAGAQGFAPARRAEPRVIVEHSPVLPGETVWVAIDFEIEDEWHTYWPGINDSGLALDARLTLSPNASAGGLLWPAPKRYSPSEGILDHVFEERMTVLLPIEVGAEARPGERVTIEFDLNWLVCRSACIIEEAVLNLALPIAPARGEPDPGVRETFAAARSRLPSPPKLDDNVEIQAEGSAVRFQAIGAHRLAFYPSEDSRQPRDLLSQGASKGESLSIDFRDSEAPVVGVLEVWPAEGEDSSVYAVRWPPEPRETESQDHQD